MLWWLAMPISAQYTPPDLQSNLLLSQGHTNNRNVQQLEYCNSIRLSSPTPSLCSHVRDNIYTRIFSSLPCSRPEGRRNYDNFRAVRASTSPSVSDSMRTYMSCMHAACIKPVWKGNDRSPLARQEEYSLMPKEITMTARAFRKCPQMHYFEEEHHKWLCTGKPCEMPF